MPLLLTWVTRATCSFLHFPLARATHAAPSRYQGDLDTQPLARKLFLSDNYLSWERGATHFEGTVSCLCQKDICVQIGSLIPIPGAEPSSFSRFDTGCRCQV